MQKDGDGAPTPTGCFKCGRTGHWSRDCPSSGPANPNPNPSSTQRSTPFNSKFSHGASKTNSGKFSTVDGEAPPTAAKRVPKTRPKLTPELLLSDDGLGYVLRHFPKGFKYHGRGHEARDLSKLISLYAQWHSHLMSYYSFDQFVHKVEQIGSTRRVRMCLRDLRDRVANGGDPTKLHEPPTETVDLDCEPESTDTQPSVLVKDDSPIEINDADDSPIEINDADEIQEEMFNEIYRNATEKNDADDSPIKRNDADDIPEEMFNDIYRNATEESPQSMAKKQTFFSQNNVFPDANPESIPVVQGATKMCNENSNDPNPSKIQITEEQKARMEANRLKAMERAAARAHALQG